MLSITNMVKNSVITIPFQQFQNTKGENIPSVVIVSVYSASPKTYGVSLQTDEDGRVVATCPALPGVVTDGKDEEEAVKNAYDAVRAMFEAMGMKEDFNLVEL